MINWLLVTWNLDDDGGYPVEKFVLKYRLDESLSNSSSTQHWNVIGGFQLLDLIITELKSHMTCYNSMPLIG